MSRVMRELSAESPKSDTNLNSFFSLKTYAGQSLYLPGGT